MTTTTAPVNIIVNAQKTCYSKCNFSFKYPIMGLVINNKTNNLLLKPDGAQDSPVIYNNIAYNLQHIGIYWPSLHKYTGNPVDAEIVMVHTSSIIANLSLVICIPIIATALSTPTDASEFLHLIIEEAGKRANSANKKTVFTNPRFTPNFFIPMKPYVSYAGTDFMTFNVNRDYIVFLKDDGISIKKEDLDTLKSIISTHSINVKTDAGGLFYNANGPEKQTTGEIYIDCRPTGDDGEILVVKKPDNEQLVDKYAVRDAMNHKLVKMIIGAIAMVVIWVLAFRIINAIARGATKSVSVVVNKLQDAK